MRQSRKRNRHVAQCQLRQGATERLTRVENSAERVHSSTPEELARGPSEEWARGESKDRESDSEDRRFLTDMEPRLDRADRCDICRRSVGQGQDPEAENKVDKDFFPSRPIARIFRGSSQRLSDTSSA